jgi:hypothetical protein
MITKKAVEDVANFMIERYELALAEKVITQAQHDEWVSFVMSWAEMHIQSFPRVLH